MEWRGKHGPFGRAGYHHGNLKEALIAAARRLIAEHGPSGFSLNEASRTAGVSASAPYRHFRDRNALIEATAEEGFRLFRERLEASAAGSADAYDALCRMGAAYYGFAMDEPGFYQAMFSSGLPKVGAPGSAPQPQRINDRDSHGLLELPGVGLSAREDERAPVIGPRRRWNRVASAPLVD